MRIVSLCPSLTELVFDLGRGADLVGITDYCVHPAGKVDGLEKIGGTKTPDVARILCLAPDIVLLNEEENRLEDVEQLRAAGLVCHTSMPRDCAETAAMVRSISAALERTAAGERISSDIEERSARVRAEAVGGAPVTWAYLIWRKPWMSVSDDTFAAHLLNQSGGRNVFADASARYPEITLADLALRDPRLVLLCSEPFPFQEKHADELARSTGLVRERIVLADGEYLSWHGSRTPDGIDYARELVLGAL